LHGQRSAPGPFGDEAEHDVVRARVREPLTGRARRRLRGRHGDELLGPPRPRGSTENTRVVDIVGEPGRVPEELPDGDLVPARKEARHPPSDGVVETQLDVTDEVEHEGFDERLRDAPGAEPDVGRHRRRPTTVGEAAGLGRGRTSVSDDDEDARRALLDHAIQQRAEALVRRFLPRDRPRDPRPRDDGQHRHCGGEVPQGQFAWPRAYTHSRATGSETTVSTPSSGRPPRIPPLSRTPSVPRAYSAAGSSTKIRISLRARARYSS